MSEDIASGGGVRHLLDVVRCHLATRDLPSQNETEGPTIQTQNWDEPMIDRLICDITDEQLIAAVNDEWVDEIGDCHLRIGPLVAEIIRLRHR